MSTGLKDKKAGSTSSSDTQGSANIDEDVKKFGFELAFIKSLQEGKGNAKELVEKYSKIFLGVSAVLSTINYTACYLLVSSGGADIVAFLANLGIKDIDPKTATIGGNMAIAYVFYKVSCPHVCVCVCVCVCVFRKAASVSLFVCFYLFLRPRQKSDTHKYAHIHINTQTHKYTHMHTHKHTHK
jgi:hypothetical protein